MEEQIPYVLHRTEAGTSVAEVCREALRPNACLAQRAMRTRVGDLPSIVLRNSCRSARGLDLLVHRLTRPRLKPFLARLRAYAALDVAHTSFLLRTAY